MSMIRFYLEGNIKNKIFSGGSRGGAKGPGLSAPPLLSQGMDDPPPPPLIWKSGSAPDISTFLDCLAGGQKGEYFSPFQKA